MNDLGMCSILDEWAEKKIDGKAFNEVFQVDGIPTWHFLGPLIKSPVPLFKPLKSRLEIEDRIKKNILPPKFEKVKTGFLVPILKKGLVANERIKSFISPSKKIEKLEAKDVLFLGYTNLILKYERGEPKFLGFNDVVNELEKRKVRCLVLVADPISSPFLQLRKHENLLRQYIDSSTLKTSGKIAKDLNNKWNALDEEIKIRLFTLHGKSYWNFLKNEVNFLFSKEMLLILVQYYFTFKKIIRQTKARIIYLTSLTGVHEVPFVCAAHKLDIKILYSTHGYGSAFPRYVPKECHKNILFLASGKDEQEVLLKFGGIKRNIFITGSPFVDGLAKFKHEKKKKKEKIVCFMTQPLVEEGIVRKKEYFAYISKFLMQVSRSKSVGRIIVKLHPNEKYKSKYESIIKSRGMKNVEVLQRSGKEFLYSILSRSDLSISFASTTDIEGMMLGADVVVIEGIKPDIYRKEPYKKAVTQVEKDEDLTGVVESILTDERTKRKVRQKREKFLKWSFHKIDGKAYKRVADLIVSLVRKGAPP